MRSDISFRKKTDNVIEVWASFDSYFKMEDGTQEDTGRGVEVEMLGRITPIRPVSPSKDKFTFVVLSGGFSMTTRVMGIIYDHMKLLEEANNAV